MLLAAQLVFSGGFWGGAAGFTFSVFVFIGRSSIKARAELDSVLSLCVIKVMDWLSFSSATLMMDKLSASDSGRYVQPKLTAVIARMVAMFATSIESCGLSWSFLKASSMIFLVGAVSGGSTAG